MVEVRREPETSDLCPGAFITSLHCPPALKPGNSCAVINKSQWVTGLICLKESKEKVYYLQDQNHLKNAKSSDVLKTSSQK